MTQSQIDDFNINDLINNPMKKRMFGMYADRSNINGKDLDIQKYFNK